MQSNLLLIKKNLYEIEIQKAETEALLIGLPLHISGNLIFSNVFSYTLGFNWLIYLTRGIRTHINTPNLPTVYYDFDWPSHTASDGDESCWQIYKKSFVIQKISYRINPINFLAVPLNYIFSNLGRIFGYAIVSPFTIPAYLLINCYYGLKKFSARYHYKNLHSQQEQERNKQDPKNDPVEMQYPEKHKILINFRPLDDSTPPEAIDTNSVSPQ